MASSRAEPRPLELAGFIEPLRAEAKERFAQPLRDLMGAADASVAIQRDVSIATRGPTRVLVRQQEAVLALVLRHGRDAPWQAGPLSFTVEPSVEGKSPTAHPTSRAWLVRLGRWFTESSVETLVKQGAELDALHHRWATLHAIHDRDYRHVEHAHSGPAAFMRPSFRCNQDCHFCWEGRDWPEPPDELVMRWLDQLAASGASRITFCGGEPTLHRRLPELVERAARTHGMSVHLHTNAIRFKDPAYTRALVAAGMSTLLVSFHSADAEVSDAMTRARGTWKRTVEGIHALLEAGVAVAINCVVERANVAGLEAHARFVREHFVEAHPSNPVRMVNYSQPGRYYDADHFGRATVPLDEARPHVVAASRVLHAAGVLLEITGTCGFPSCIAREIPEMVPWRANESHDPTHASGRERPEACKRCAARDHCVGVRREYLSQFGERGLLPFERLHASDWYERAARAGLGGDWALAANTP